MYDVWKDGYDSELEALRQKLLDNVCAGGYFGMPAMLLDEDRIKDADPYELHEIARTYGYES